MSRNSHRLSCFVFGLREFAGAGIVFAMLLAMRGDVLAQDSTASPSKVTAWLRVGDAPSATPNPAYRNSAEYEAYRKTQAARIKSPVVLQNVIRQLSEDSTITVLQAEKAPQRWLEDRLKVVAPLESELIGISISDVDPVQAVKIVNAVRDSYLATVVEEEKRQDYDKFKLLQTDLLNIRDDLDNKQNILTELSRRNSQLTDGGNLAREHHSNLDRLLTRVRERRLEIDLQVAGAKTRLTLAAADSPEATKAKIEMAVAEAQQEVLSRAKDELTTELENSAAETAKAVQAQADVAALKATIADLQKMRAKRTDELRDVKLQLEMPARVQALEKATMPEK